MTQKNTQEIIEELKNKLGEKAGPDFWIILNLASAEQEEKFDNAVREALSSAEKKHDKAEIHRANREIGYAHEKMGLRRQISDLEAEINDRESEITYLKNKITEKECSP